MCMAVWLSYSVLFLFVSVVHFFSSGLSVFILLIYRNISYIQERNLLSVIYTNVCWHMEDFISFSQIYKSYPLCFAFFVHLKKNNLSTSRSQRYSCKFSSKSSIILVFITWRFDVCVWAKVETKKLFSYKDSHFPHCIYWIKCTPSPHYNSLLCHCSLVPSFWVY